HGAAQREGRQEEGGFQATAGGQPGGTGPGGGEPCGGRNGRRAVGRAWAFRHVCRVQWKRAASASRRVGDGGDTGGRRADGGGASGD
ncbi:MAG: hypothetical protein ACK56I_19920, partial [bacterium]